MGSNPAASVLSGRNALAAEKPEAREGDPLPARNAPGPYEPVISALAYFTFVPAAIFLLTGRFRRSRLVRFHSLQSIFLLAALLVAALAVRGIFLLFSFAPSLAFLIGWIAAFLVVLAFFLVWVVLILKALRGEMFELPWLGKIATRQSA
jgi:uncharacterized membrane protein